MFQTSPRHQRLKAIVFGAGLATLALTEMATPAFADPVSPEGIWYTKDNESIIKFQPCKPNLCGTVVWLKDPLEKDSTPFLDKNNPDPAKRTKPMIGLEIFSALAPDADHWKGKAYNADNGKTYDITITVKMDKEPNEASVRGCILGFLCGSETFTRASEVPGGDPTVADATPVKPGKPHPVKKDTAKK